VSTQRRGVTSRAADGRGPAVPPGKRASRFGSTRRPGVVRAEVDRAEAGNYQTLMNDALRAHVEGTREDLERKSFAA